ncbi:permease prefix domain 1-containing protein, partial [Streptomyces sp. SID3343]|uniref:permease prefix domain 1-containing protein n=1 Tax=Streptomyces sp. SID3343 TaxID=2690260 RepID=UPI001370CE75|nr:hypothetical protein [Streptomyces sp. SID3343]
MSAVGGRADPVEDYVAVLSATLRGPARAKARMVEEIRDGLADTIEAHTRAGTPYERAADEAVREFGSTDELAPNCQRELTIVQTRHTARAVGLTVPFLIACWLLTRTADHAQGRQLQLLALHTAGIAAAAALLAAATPAAIDALGRRWPTP